MGENQYSRYVLVHFYPETFPGIMQKKTEVICTAEIPTQDSSPKYQPKQLHIYEI